MSSRKLPEGILSGRTGSQTLALISGDAQPKKKRAPRVKTAPAAAPADDDRIEPVLCRISLRHKRALIAEAQRRAEATASAKSGISEVLREVLDAWLEGREP